MNIIIRKIDDMSNHPKNKSIYANCRYSFPISNETRYIRPLTHGTVDYIHADTTISNMLNSVAVYDGTWCYIERYLNITSVSNRDKSHFHFEGRR